MSDAHFAADWLELREPADRRARDSGLLALLADRLRGKPAQIVDLGTGSASNLRALAPLLGPRQHWWLLDHDAQLLDRIPGRLREWAAAQGWTWNAGTQTLQGAGHLINVQWRQVDLAKAVPASAAFNHPLDATSLVTASALLDLVSEAWLQQLVMQCCAARATLYFSLSYDGRIDCEPPLPDDALLRELVNRHQQGDKSFGAALGPAAVPLLMQQLASQDYAIHTARSDWQLDADERPLQQQLLAGWAAAAQRFDAAAGPRIDAWLAARLAQMARRALRLRVGHLDVLAMPRDG